MLAPAAPLLLPPLPLLTRGRGLGGGTWNARGGPRQTGRANKQAEGRGRGASLLLEGRHFLFGASLPLIFGASLPLIFWSSLAMGGFSFDGGLLLRVFRGAAPSMEGCSFDVLKG